MFKIYLVLKFHKNLEKFDNIKFFWILPRSHRPETVRRSKIFRLSPVLCFVCPMFKRAYFLFSVEYRHKNLVLKLLAKNTRIFRLIVGLQILYLSIFIHFM
ncbi:MAG: hypothetical protein DRG11_05140 [Epsilonproteobacteria bacterium]|nr:MAG: hypothetical protein DRG11_05140 [Campylobacterota bacterium]